MDLKNLLRNRKACGILIKVLGHPATVLIAKDVGMDFLFYDCEHGSLSYERLHDLMVLGNQAGIPSLVRVPQLARGDVSRILDFGASGVMVPMIESAKDARKLVEWSKYPPIGRRSYSGGANTDYGPSGGHAANMERMNQKTMTIVQIETGGRGAPGGRNPQRGRGSTPPVIGPCDLGISMANPDHVMDEPRACRSYARVAEACRRHGRFFGIIGSMELMKYFERGTGHHHVTAVDTNLLAGRDGGRRGSVSETQRK